MGDLNLKAASGGQIALTPTNTASNYTLTLPAATGNIITSADSGTVTPSMLSTGAPTWTSGGVLTANSDIVSQYLSIKDLANTNDFVFRFNTYSGTQVGYFGVTSSANNISIQATNNLIFLPGGSEKARIDTNGYLLVGYTSSNGAYKLQVNSQIFATSSIIATSDARYKENVAPITDGLMLINALNPVSFDWKQHPVHEFDLENKQVGFLAQEVQTAIADKPYLNSIIKANECELPDGTKEAFLGIAEGNMIAILTSAIKELSTKLDAAIAEIETLKGAK